MSQLSSLHQYSMRPFGQRTKDMPFSFLYHDLQLVDHTWKRLCSLFISYGSVFNSHIPSCRALHKHSLASAALASPCDGCGVKICVLRLRCLIYMEKKLIRLSGVKDLANFHNELIIHFTHANLQHLHPCNSCFFLLLRSVSGDRKLCKWPDIRSCC